MITYPILRLYLQGETIEFKDRDVISATVTQEISPLGMELPAATAEISVYTTNSDFNPFRDALYFNALKANTPADLIEYEDGAERLVSRFYLDEWSNPSKDVLKFSLHDAIGVMDNITFEGVFYEQPTTVKSIVRLLRLYAPCSITVDSDLTNVELKGYIKGHITLRAALQQVCFATGAQAITQGIDRVHIMPTKLPDAGAVLVPAYYDDASAIYDDPDVRYSDFIIDGVITDLEKLDRQELTILQMVTAVELVTHDYIKSDAVETIFDDTLVPGDYKIIYEKPYGDVLVDGAGDIPEWIATEGGEIIVTEDSGIYPNVTIIGKTGAWEFGPNSISLHITTISHVIITGHPYEDNTQVLGWNNPDSLQDYTAPNVWRITDALLVNKDAGQAILENIVKYAQARYQQTVTALADKSINVGNVYLVDSLYDKKIIAGAEQISVNLAGGNLKETRLIGVEELGG